MCNLGKLYLLPKIHKRLSEVPGRPVISNCGAPTEKVSEFLDFHLISTIQEGASYIKDTADFQDKIKNLRVPKDAFLVTADVVGLYPNIPYEAGLKSLKEALDRRREKKISTEDLVKMAEFVLKITTLSLIEVFANKCRVLLLAQSSTLLMPVSLWIALKIVFWKHKA